MNAASQLPPARHEATDGLPRVVAFTGCGIALGIALVLAASAWIYPSNSGKSGTPAGSSRELSFENGPDATTGVARDWAAQDQAVHDHLEIYAWIDRPAGVVRIPIERAMKLLATESAGKSADTDQWSRSGPASVRGKTAAGSPRLQERPTP